MVKTRAQRIKRMRAEKTETWNVVDAEGVFLEILSRVSVKSILSFKTLSKHWYDSISSKYFCKLQLAHSRKNPSFIVCPIMERAVKLYSMEARSFELSPLNIINHPERSHEEFMYMISSFNGLICCVNSVYDKDVEKVYDLHIHICNPCTGETLLLPRGRPSFEFEPSVGVAYSSDTSDFTVFRIFCTGKKFPEERESVEGYYIREGQLFTIYRYSLAYECEVYSSRTGSWKNIGPVPCVPMRSGFRRYRTGHIFVGGKIYWLVSLNEPGEILSVDLEGRFEVINLPEYPAGKEEDGITEATYLIILQGSLGLLVQQVWSMDIWVLKDDGKKYSWEFVLRDRIPMKNDETFLAVTSLNNQILCGTETRWHIYDVETGKWKKKRGPRNVFRNPAAFPYTESVLPCIGSVNL